MKVSGKPAAATEGEQSSEGAHLTTNGDGPEHAVEVLVDHFGLPTSVGRELDDLKKHVMDLTAERDNLLAQLEQVRDVIDK